MASGGNMNYQGAYVGTGAEQLIVCGFQPRKVVVTNTDTGSQVELTEFLADHETAAKRGGRKTNGADGIVSFLAATAGITLEVSGFKVYTDAACNASGIGFYFEAID